MKIDPNVRALLEKSVQIDGKPVISQTTGGATKDAGHEDHVLRWEYPGNGTVKWRIPYIIGNVSKYIAYTSICRHRDKMQVFIQIRVPFPWG